MNHVVNLKEGMCTHFTKHEVINIFVYEIFCVKYKFMINVPIANSFTNLNCFSRETTFFNLCGLVDPPSLITTTTSGLSELD